MALEAAISALGGNARGGNPPRMPVDPVLNADGDAERASPANMAQLDEQIKAYRNDPKRLAPLLEEKAAITVFITVAPYYASKTPGWIEFQPDAAGSAPVQIFHVQP